MKYKKLIIGVILIAILLSLFVYSSIEHNKYHPDLDYILSNFEKYNNTDIRLGGRITNVDLAEQIIFIKSDGTPYKEFTINISKVNFKGEIGDHIEIFGTLNSPNQITAKKILVNTSWKYDLVYIRSLPAIPFALYLFFRAWKFNFKTYIFEKREKKFKGKENNSKKRGGMNNT